jgi:hypothetical protein
MLCGCPYICSFLYNDYARADDSNFQISRTSTDGLPALVLRVLYLVFHGVVNMHAGRHGEPDSAHDDDRGYCDAIAISMGLTGAGHGGERN